MLLRFMLHMTLMTTDILISIFTYISTADIFLYNRGMSDIFNIIRITASTAHNI